MGYRPCKLCHPLECPDDIPEWLKPLLLELDKRSDYKFRDYELRDLGFNPSRVRRWFKKHHDMTFQTYLRLSRLNKAFGKIANGEKVIESAYDAGYDSLSGFTDSFKNRFGKSPKKIKDQTVVTVARIITPLGPMYAGATDDGLCLLEFADQPMLETQLKRLEKYLKAEFLPGNNNHLLTIQQQLQEYFDGRRTEFEISLITPGTKFQKSVWNSLMEIPYGGTKSYKEQAEYLKNPKAIRAIARANGDNRIAIVIPCHRVIGSNGEMVGYGGGIRRKEFLLNLEKANN